MMRISLNYGMIGHVSYTYVSGEVKTPRVDPVWMVSPNAIKIGIWLIYISYNKQSKMDFVLTEDWLYFIWKYGSY